MLGDLTQTENLVRDVVSKSRHALLPSEVVESLSGKVPPAEVREALREMVQDGHIRFRYDARVILK